MSASGAGHRGRGQGVGANRHRHSNELSREQLHRENERLLRENQELRRKIAEREKQIVDAEKQIADLERQLALRRQNSTNSSKPPSSDGLAGEQRPRGRKHKSKRKSGAQPGHAGHHRRLVPTVEVSTIKVLLPKQCGHCGGSLPQKPGQVTTEGEPRRHQVTEIPPLKAHITEYQLSNVVCGHCGKTTRAPLPAEIAGNFGSQLTALVAYLTVVCRMPRRVVEALLMQVLGIEISLGSTQKCWEETSQAVAAPCQKLEQQLKDEPVLNVDETGWRTNGDKRFLWAFVAARYVVYTVAASRGSEVLIRLLGAVFQGILCSDRFSAYLKYHKGTAQFCWAHLKRNLLGMVEFTKSSAVERFCRDALAQHARLFRLWHKFRGGQIDRRQLILRSIPIEKRIVELAERHLDSPHREVRNLATALFEHNARLFTFLEQEGVEPTNNSAERALRTGVQWRKICFGNRSAKGELATARLLTVAETCDCQRRNILAYLAAAIVRHRSHQQVASLLLR
ncbi:MAG TPA: IS66 family transposase [Candidatus Sulfotelmatobacter sp.]